MRPRFHVILIACLMIVAAACSTGTGGTDSALDEVEDRGTVRIGVRNDNPPMSFLDDSGAWIGFDVDLATALAIELDAELELVVVDGTTRISFVQSGNVDMSIASMNHTRARDEAIDFSITYFWDNQSFLIRTGTYGSIDDLIGQTVLLPLMNREIPIAADEAVEQESGTGAVKVTPAHDPNDPEIAQRDRKSTRPNPSHTDISRMPSSV